MSKYRKAIAAALVPLLALPLAGWVSGEVPFSWSVLVAGVIAAVSGWATWRFPNAGGTP